MKSKKAVAAIKPKCTNAPVAVKRDMEKYKYDFSFNMPSDEFLECMRYFAEGYKERHLKRVSEGREF